MNTHQIYILLFIIVLAVITIILFFVNKNKKKKLSKLAGLSFVFILAGITFGDNRLISYSLMGIGVILAIIDIILKRKK